MTLIRTDTARYDVYAETDYGQLIDNRNDCSYEYAIAWAQEFTQRYPHDIVTVVEKREFIYKQEA